MRKITEIIVHHTASDRDTTTAKAVDRYHRDKDWGGGARAAKSSLGWYITYHYFIEASGRVIQCAKDSEIRWHAAAQNPYSLGICLAGWFDDGHDTKPTDAQVQALKSLLNGKSKEYGITKAHINPHRKFARKSCYGYHLSDTWAADLLNGTVYQITDPRHLSRYRPDQTIKRADGSIVLKEGVTPLPGTTKTLI